MEYVAGEKGGECIFCEPTTPVPDRQRLILHRGREVFVLLNRFPYTSGHLMVAPYAHTGCLEAVEVTTRNELIARVVDCTHILRAVFGCEGINVGANLGQAAGAGIEDHVHFHLVPRWSGDTNFMTAVGELRVIPEHLERTYDRLAPAFGELESA
jgi:ATP adenylyltransferase